MYGLACYHAADGSQRAGEASSTPTRSRRNWNLDMADHVVDAKGLNCPLPILRARKGLKEVPVGGTLELLATDPGSVKDMEAFCRQTGNELLESGEADGVFTFLVKRSG
jgi:tRNA 2-thiouridine synthesizing protein A